MLNGNPSDVLLDYGSQVSIIDREWHNTHIPHYTVRPPKELIDGPLNLRGVMGHAIPYDGWVELTINCGANDSPHLIIPTPFLVSQEPEAIPLVDSNVLEELLKSVNDGVVTVVVDLLRQTLRMEEEQLKVYANFLQVPPKSDCGPAVVRVGKDNIIVRAGQTVHINCRVPLNFDASDRLFLYEPLGESTAMRQLSVGESLLEIQNTQRPRVKLPICNHSMFEITLPKRTVLGTIQHIGKVLP